MTTSALVVLSGGQDSTTCAAWAKTKFRTVRAITFDYGQTHIRELDAARKVAEILELDSHEIVTVGPILGGRSPLTNRTEKLETYNSFSEMEEIIGARVEKTFVPMRNALFLTLAANHAMCADIYDIVTGVCEADNANYPDCRKSFIDAQQKAINEALGVSDFKIWTPLISLSKAQSIKLAQTLPNCMRALAFSHTAYSGEWPPVTQDHATVLRAQGFLEAGVPDPLIVRAWREGLMELPTSSNYDAVWAGLQPDP
jgi:7-cyano-7-deazaguanine synthase